MGSANHHTRTSRDHVLLFLIDKSTSYMGWSTLGNTNQIVKTKQAYKISLHSISQNIDATHDLRVMYQLQDKDTLSMCVYVEFLPIWLCVFLVLGSSKLLVDLEYSPQYNERKTVDGAEMT